MQLHKMSGNDPCIHCETKIRQKICLRKTVNTVTSVMYVLQADSMARRGRSSPVPADSVRVPFATLPEVASSRNAQSMRILNRSFVISANASGCTTKDFLIGSEWFNYKLNFFKTVPLTMQWWLQD